MSLPSCTYIPGNFYTSANVGCSDTSYKKNISNDDCAECPTNTVSNMDSTGCVCKNGYHKSSPNNSELSPCYGKPSICISQTVWSHKS